jgi:hypothetical protein
MKFQILDLRFWIAKVQTQKQQVGLSPRQKGDNPKKRRHCAAYEQASHYREIKLEVLAPILNVAGEPPETQEGKLRSGHHDQPQHHKGNADDD